MSKNVEVAKRLLFEHLPIGACSEAESMIRVPVQPTMLRWACERSQIERRDLEIKIPQLPRWIVGEKLPTLKQLERFARATHTPIGYLFLQEPPVEEVPIPDFRSREGNIVNRPSPNLLETIYLCQERQAWYRDYAKSTGEGPLSFVGSVSKSDDVVGVAAEIRSELGIDLEDRRSVPTWSEALRRLIVQADDAGVMVMVSGVVGGNTHRKLDPDEFRGFALVDEWAPLVFVNGADFKSAQMFTVAHELAHVWLGQSALSNSQARVVPNQEVERWCNLVAAETLVPLEILRAEIQKHQPVAREASRLARRFKVSTLVVLRRIFDSGYIDRDVLRNEYGAEISRLQAIPRKSGGNFYPTLGARVSRRFARGVVASTLEGASSFSEAFRLLGVKKAKTFHGLKESLGMGF